jgi:polyisoprenoid-binding protein YceI
MKLKLPLFRPMKVSLLQGLLLITAGTWMGTALAADYVVDVKGAHASINFKIPHLGYSMLIGRFDEFSGTFAYDQASPADAKVDVLIKTASHNSNHAGRDKHLRSGDFLDVDKYPEARFVSSKFTSADGKTGKLEGNLTLHGVTKAITIDVTKVGEGKDPWGGYRAGFSGTATLTLKDFNINADMLGPASQQVELELYVEGVRQ